ncbi:outer membrane protein assembly factor BamA [Candidatus Neomarinimicrobiota bacterium]
MFKNFVSSFILIIAQLSAQNLPTVMLDDVVVEGNDRASVSVVQSTARLFPGRSVTAMDIQSGVRRLWELGFFGDVQIYFEPREDDLQAGVLRIAVTEYPSLEEVEFDGNKKLSKNKLKEAMDLAPPKILSEYNISEAVRKIRKEYQESGYLNVEITTDQQPGQSKYGRILTIKIDENKKVRLKKINLIGNEVYKTFVLKLQMKNTKRWHWFMFWREPFDQDKFEEDQNTLIAYYQNRGYRDARIVSDSLYTSENGKYLKLDIVIHEGIPYFYRNFTWEGNILHTDEELNRALGFKRGDEYDKEGFGMAVSQKVHPVYMDEGYLYSQINPVEYPIGKDSLDVAFHIVENQKVAVRYINVEGNERTRDYVIRRELRINPGETFSYEKLGRSQRDIWILNYFENVEPNVLPVDDDEVDLSVTVTERSTGRANLSVGYTESYGMIGGGGVEFQNLAGTGQQLSLSYNRGSQFGLSSASQRNTGAYQSFSISLVNPWLFNTPNLVGISAFYSERGQVGSSLYLPFDIVQRGGSMRWGRRFRWPDNFFRGAWILQASEKRYIGERDQLINYLAGLDTNDVHTQSDGRDYVSTIGVSLTQSISRDSRDRPEFPTSGSEMAWVSTLSGSILGGNEDFHKHILSLKWYVPVVNRVVFYHSAKLGVIKQLLEKNSRSILPPEEKFYLGGSGIPFGEMLRGYPDNTVGPYSGRPLGARAMFKYSAELRVSLSENPTVYALAFVDLGNSWLDWDFVDPFNLKRSAGVGVRMFMPMLGMLGLDAGYGFDSVSTDYDRSRDAQLSGPRGWEIHFLFGQPF